MNPDLQFTLLIIAIIAFYYIYWLIRTLQENKKMREIREHGQEIDAPIYNIESNLRRMGNKYNVQVRLETPLGIRMLVNYPKIRQSPFRAGMEVPIIYYEKYRNEYIFAEQRVLKMDRPFGVTDNDRINPVKLVIRTIVVWAICAAVIWLGLYFFGSGGVYYN